MPPSSAEISPLPPFKPDLYTRAWSSTPHPSLPLLATAHEKSVIVFSLSTLTKHSTLTGGHARSVRSAAWQPSHSSSSPTNSPPNRLRLVTASFDSTAALWSYDESSSLEKEVTAIPSTTSPHSDGEAGPDEPEWEFNLVLEGHENEVKSLSFSPSGQYLATCTRDKKVWIWEDVGDEEDEYEWETVAILDEHDGDVKYVAFAPHIEGRKKYGSMQSSDVLASASYDDTVRIWREDVADDEWVCVSVLQGHGGTVWGLQWEGLAREDGKFPRLLTNSADGMLRVWALKEDDGDEEEEGLPQGQGFKSGGFGAIPNSMRRSLKEEWECTAVLPKVHTREVYSAAWSAETGIVASTGSDGKIVLYAEDKETKEWKVIATVEAAHGPYEVNHITWCKRFDAGTDRKGQEEMLVTTGDDGVVRPWQVRIA